MNAGIYRLVYNEFRSIWMVVSEIAKSHQPGSGTKRVRKSRHFLLLALIVVASDAWADSAINTIAINAIPNVTVTTGANTVINASVVNPANSAGYLLSIQQADKKAILSGPSFDIGRASVVNFNHTGGAGSATLIRISDGPKTTIEGALNSPNGQIYLINQNGILFGNGARVDVNGLVASTLNMRDSDFMNDLGQLYAYTDKKRAAYVWNTDKDGVANVNGLAFSDSLVQIEPDARIKAALGSSVMLFGTGVINKGSIETSEGQVVLAAGGKVYLSFAPDLNFDPANPKDSVPAATYAKDSPYRALAGVLVEVDPHAKDVAVLPQDLLGVTNDVSGRILAQRGNITMAALMVNQSGRIVATTSVSQKGSIRLLARDTKVETAAVGFTANGTTTSNGNIVITGSRTGELIFGDNSQTLILPEHAAGVALANQHLGVNQIGEPAPAPHTDEKSFVDTVLAALSPTGNTVTDEQIFNAPTLEAVGNTVIVNDGANIVASGGFINLSSMIATSTSRLTEPTRLYIGKNTLIDASGLKEVAVSMDRNFVEVLLTSNDLQDDPLNKAGFLYHKSVWFDIRHLPDTRVASLAGYLKQVPRDIGEKLATAGTVTLSSEGDLVQRVGSVVDVSGGSLNYTTGTHKETWLQDINGNAYALSTAPAGVTFTGFLNNSNYRTYQEHAYSEGVMAGSVSINALAINLDGQFKGGAAYGEYQRNSANLGGLLALNINENNPENIEFLNKNNIASLADSFASDTLLNSSPTMIDVGMLSNSGFENLSFSTAGNVTTHAALNLALASKLALTGQKIEINDDIVSRGGSITLTSTIASIAVNPSVKLDASGLWTNDYINPALASGRIVNKGGSVNISAQGAVSLGQGSVVDVSGGGSLNSAGKVTNGDAGSIAIEANRVKDSSGTFTGTTSDVKPILAGELRGYALGVGGNLSITAPFVTIGATGIGDDRELLLNPLFFQNGGFTSYNLIGRDGVLVKGDAQVDVQAQNYQLTSNYRLAETGAHVADFAKTTLLADFLRSSTSLTLASQQASPLVSTTPFNIPGIAFGRGSVMVQTGATLQVDSRGSKTLPSIALSGWDNQVYVDGTLKADGGTIALTMNGDPVNDVNDSDFNASQAIWLGSNAKLQVAGYSQLTPNSTGLRAGTVYDGGTISLNAKKGYIVAKSGSLLDVSGGSATLDILNTPTNIASNGGTVNLTAREGMLLDASFNAEAPGALGGNLNIVIGRGTSNNLYRVNHQTLSTYPGYNDINYDNEYPNQQWVIDVVQSKANAGAGFSAGLVSGDSIQASAGGLAKVNADSINHGGFARATLKAADVIRFEENVSLNLPSSLRLDAPIIEALGSSTVSLNAPAVMLSNALISDADIATRISSNYSAPAPSTGTATLNINSQLLDLRGQFSLSGFSQSNLISSNDIRLTGFSSSTNAPVGELRTTGTLNMTARQIYPTSLTDYTLSVEGAGGSAVFNGTGAHDAVLSAGGKLTVNAENIDQKGVLLAPFGTIALNASQNLTLENGSLTSVAANGALIPFGYTNRDGLDYLYNFGSGISSIVAPPERVVKLNAPNVTASAGSTVDISSGGDLYAYEWVPGVGGSTDVLANGAKQSAFSTLGSNASNTWAIMPASKLAYGSYDTQYWNGANVQAGDAVYLSGMPGLAAGYYTLLPARYALLPGAMLVSAVSGHQDIRAGNALAQNDGSSLVSGHLAAYTSDGYVSTSRTAGFLVRAGSDSRKLAEYSDTLSSQRYAGVTNVMQTVDAGRYSVAATSSMVLDGVLKALHAQTGKGAEVDVAAPKLLVVNHGEQTGLVEVDGNNYLAVDEKTLTNMNASSLLLGGTRSNGLVEVVSSEVRMGANASLSGPEVILAATDKVILKNTATVTGTGSGGSQRDLTIGRVAVAEVVDPTTEVVTTPAAIAIDGNGALLRVSGEKAVNLTRINADRSHGDLQIENGATVQGDGAVQLDATHGMSVAGTLGFGAGGALTVAAGRVSLGSPDNNAQVTDGLWLTQEQLAPLQQASSLVLKSYSTIDLYGAVNVGNDKLDLTMQSAGVAGYQNADQTAKITARTLTLNNADKVDFTDAPVLSDLTMPVSGTNGTLEVSAQTIVSAANTVRLAGFDQVNLSASKEIVAQGVGSLNADKALTLSAGRVTALTTADHTIAATNGLLKIEGYRVDDLVVAPTDASKLLAPAQSAKLNLQGTSVILAEYANIVAQGAKVTLQATGQNATDSVTMQSGSSIMTKGSATTIKDQTIVLPAGKVALISDHGNVELQSGSVVDVSPATGGNAGTVNITAVNGNATLAGTVVGGANAVANVDAMAIVKPIVDGDGKPVVDENGDPTFLPFINETLTALQGFAGSQSYRMRTGDAAITTDVSTKNFVLTADAGFITVDSKIDASGDKGGSIELYARDNLTVNSGAQLIAKGTADKLTTAGTTGNGGKVILSSDIGIVSADSQATIDVTASEAKINVIVSVDGVGGKVLRAENSAFNPVVTTGTGSIYETTISDFTLTAGVVVAFTANTDSSAKAQLNVSSTGAKSLMKDGGTAVDLSELKSGKTYIAVYDGTNFQLISSPQAKIDVTGSQAKIDGSQVKINVVVSVDGVGGNVILRAARTNTADNSAFNPVATTGTGSIYVATVSDFILTAGTVVAFIANTNSKALAKLNVNSTGVKSLMKSGGTTVALNELRSGKTYIAVYDGSNFQLVSSSNQASGSDVVGTGVNVNASTTAAITGASKVSIEAVKVYLNPSIDGDGNSTIDSKYQSLVTADTNAFASRTAGISSLFSSTRDNVAALVTPGIEIRSDGDLNLVSDWVIGTSSYASPATGSPVAKMPSGGILTLRTTGSLNIMGNLAYEQYAMNGNDVSALPGTWSYRLVGGADSSSANPEMVKATLTPLIPSIYIAAGKYIRTGSGFIDAVAGGDIMLDQNAAIYTEGTPDVAVKAGFSTLVPNYLTYYELYPVNGGDVGMNALGSITGMATSSQTGNTWLYRAAKTTAGLLNPNVRWWSRFDKFVNGVAALGGGDVTVTTGGDINNLQFDSASNGRMGGSGDVSPNNAIFTVNGDLTVNGGGDVSIKAEGDITNALMAVGKGVANAQSGKSASVKFELMDASAKAYADGNLNITQVSNSTVTTPGSGGDNTPLKIFAYSYARDSAVSAVSAVGDVTLAGSTVLPGIVYAAAPNGNVTANGLTLYPSALGNATLLAGNNLNVSDFVMSDVDPRTLPQISTKPAYNSLQSAPVLNAYSGSVAHSSGLLHANDANSAPVRLYAGKDVLFSTYDAITKITTVSSAVVLPKAVEVYAGRDVVDANLIVQNNKATDVSVIEAGGNIRYSDAGVQDGAIMPNAASLQVAGPGRLQLIAGQDIDLGSSGGIRSVGDLYNPYLTPHGADIMVMPGSGNGLNYSGMINAYLESNPTMAAIYLPQLVEYMKTRQGLNDLSASDALASFKLLDSSHQSQFMNSVFYAELRAGGRDAIDAKSASFGDYTRSERAILTMFPNFTTNSALVNQPGSLMSAFKNISTETISNPGDLKLFYSQIRSEGGGDIELLVPGGYINSGLAVAGTLNKPATDLGIVSIRGGVIDAFVRNNFQVNQSRVFTLGGSDLMLYSALTNIDAGRGAKTSAATPPPVLRIRNGQITYDYSAAVSGSGIAALTATGGEPGTVDLFAPYGVIDAGEAGIRSAGNINLGAVRVIGADNIKAGGVTTGAPVASVAGVSVTAPASSNSSSQGKQGDQVGDAAKQASNNKLNAIPSMISVEILSVGDDSSVPAKSCSDRKDCQI